MKKKYFGKNKIEISPIGLGCWPIGGEMYLDGKSDAYTNIDDNESIKAIKTGIDYGINFFDTADCYGAGHSERILGKAIKGVREDLVIATKFGYTFNEESKHILGTCNTREYVIKACKDSLKRLGTEYIDLYQFHVGYLEEYQALDAMDGLLELQRSGLIREIGWSTYDEKMIDLFPENLATIQHVSNVLVNNKNMIEACQKHKLLSLNNSPLAMGLLGGKYKPGDIIPDGDVRSSGFDWVTYFDNGKPNKEFYDKMSSIRDILESNGRTLAQGSLAWIWGNSEITVPIPGFRTVKQAKDNALAMEKGPLTKTQVKEIDSILGR